MIAINLSRQANTTIFQLYFFVGELKKLHDNNNAVDADGRQSMFALALQKNLKETRLKLPQGNVTVL